MMGRGAPEVARLRTVSEGTVRSQVRSILAKLEVSSQLSAVATAWVSGYDPDSLLAPNGRGPDHGPGGRPQDA